VEPIEVAQLFHAQYELLAPKHGYTSRFPGSQWADLPQNNRDLMIAVAEVVLFEIRKADEEELWHAT
jgi:hypothetical protein